MRKMDPEMQRWIELHAADDPVKLRLRYHGDDDIAFAITQIECRRKAGNRFPAALASPGFMFPTGLSAEQATSEALARIHAGIAGYLPGARHLDLTCGLGMDAFEAARHGASVTAVDINPEVVEAARHNAKALGLDDKFEAVCGNSTTLVADTDIKCDTIFIDPARRGEGGRRLTAIAECSPDVTTIMPRMLELAPKIVVKASPMLDLTALASELDAACGGRGCVTR
ncbi:MAG: methyltransferase domain-containing protein, partial [Candidatus Amulumruptor sp.]|nr:methyltransferase domain-containing protein [Candidatus Amulumruptor sp.]